ncbi:MAG TPA: DMT family transporter, partial [Nitrospirota bacterium]|nr:DMT family transporter [Nitrospirota bacterium]
LGVVFLGIFFFLYLAALSWADLSFVLPLTAVSYLFAALLARFFLKEDVSWYRWAGTFVIVIGIALVALGGKSRSADHSLPGPPHYEFTRDRGPIID